MKNKVYQLALFGHPVHHSLSPQIHQQFAKQFGLSIQYDLIDVLEQDLESRVLEFFKSGGFGANVTLPHKQAVMSFVENSSKLALQAAAINTLYLDDKKLLKGDNTDGIGFINDLSKRCGFDCEDKKILILGAGGATQGIVPALLLQSPKLITIANRSVDKAQKIATKYNCNCQALSFDELFELNKTFDLIVHSSSLGHQGKTLKFLQQHFNASTIAYDLSYAQAAAPFIRFCQSIGVQSSYDGIGMLVEQAACAFECWFGVEPKTDKIVVS